MPSAFTQCDELCRAIRLLPPDLHERARRIRSCVAGAGDCPYCRIAERSLALACRAAAFGQHDWASVLVTEAEHYVGTGHHPEGRHSRARARPGERLPGVHGDIEPCCEADPVIAATDASREKGHGGLGHPTSTRRRAEDLVKPFLLTWRQAAVAV